MESARPETSLEVSSDDYGLDDGVLLEDPLATRSGPSCMASDSEKPSYSEFGDVGSFH